jgi:hypothetical protein
MTWGRPASAAIDEPYSYAMSGDEPAAMLARVFCSAPSLPPLKTSLTWMPGWEAFQEATWA